MMDRLLTILANIGYDTITFFVEPLVISKDRYGLKNVAQDLFISLSDFCNRTNVLFRDDEEMDRSLGVHIIEANT